MSATSQKSEKMGKKSKKGEEVMNGSRNGTKKLNMERKLIHIFKTYIMIPEVQWAKAVSVSYIPT